MNKTPLSNNSCWVLGFTGFAIVSLLVIFKGGQGIVQAYDRRVCNSRPEEADTIGMPYFDYYL